MARASHGAPFLFSPDLIRTFNCAINEDVSRFVCIIVLDTSTALIINCH